ncbi:MAG: ilvB [Clostridiales bacterium]|jgi:acetolactate synthase-1/2/3 large subunit|nr:ilvB [Clostridiales bacterium]
MLLTGAEIIIECLKEQNADTIFGYPGGQALNIYDELYKHSSEVRHILTAHEQGASHAADGYARATGKVGVCLATSGPGATNLVTGIATAYMDSVPMVAITGQVPLSLLGKDSFQEVDIAGVTMPITKHNFIVKDVTKLAETIRKAFYIAREGRPGPVLVDIPKDITAAKTEYTAPEILELPSKRERVLEKDLDKAIDMIKSSKKPYIFVGGGAISSDASEELMKFVRKINAPVADTLMGKGAFPSEDELYTGMLGMHGTKTSNIGVTNCDLLVVIGARFSDRVTGNATKFARKAKILHIDIDPAEVNKNIKVHHYLVGDINLVLKKLNAGLSGVELPKNDEWIETIKKLKADFPLSYNEDILTGQYVVEKISEITKGDAIICTEVGQHQMWTAQYYKFKTPRSFVSSGGLGTMGFGLGAALGAQLGRPDKQVINVAGDGSFRMNLNELATAARYNIPIIEVVLNNKVLGMVRQWQTLYYGGRYSYTNLDDGLDFMKLADAFGILGFRVTKKEEIEEVLQKAMAANRPVLIECVIDCDEKVWPMVAPGAAIDDIKTAADFE